MERTIGFYALYRTPDENGYIGALLVTDEIGKPEEFRVTYPVKPTPVQRQLYGQSLVPHVGVELCGVPLYRALREKPDIVLVDDERLLGIAAGVGCPVARVMRQGESLEIKVPKHTDRVQIESPSGRFDPLLVDLPPDYDQADGAVTLELLSAFSESIDLLEPFSRIGSALKELAAQNPDFA